MLALARGHRARCGKDQLARRVAALAVDAAPGLYEPRKLDEVDAVRCAARGLEGRELRLHPGDLGGERAQPRARGLVELPYALILRVAQLELRPHPGELAIERSRIRRAVQPEIHHVGRDADRQAEQEDAQ